MKRSFLWELQEFPQKKHKTTPKIKPQKTPPPKPTKKSPQMQSFLEEQNLPEAQHIS